MPSPTLKLSERTALDAESRAMIYDGASINQLSEMFHMPMLRVARFLGGLRSVGIGRQGNPLYSIPEAAARLVKPPPVTEDMITARILSMNPKQMPPLLSKLFWDGMRTRRRYEEEAGELWLSSEVAQTAAEAFQSLRMSLLLIPDQLRDETQISDAQVMLVQNVIDTTLEAARGRLIDDLRKPNQSRSGSVAPEDEPL